METVFCYFSDYYVTTILYYDLIQIVRHVSDSISRGATALTGGSVEESLNAGGGTFHQPTVLVDVKLDMPPFYEETFGPVVPLLSFDSEDEAITIANDTK